MTGKPAAHTHGEWWRPMRGRDPGEAHRASTSLELLFDLCFVVAVAQAAIDDGVATTKPGNVVQAVQDAMWQPAYPDAV